MARFARIWKTGVVVTALLATVVACGSSDASRARNAALVAGTSCTKPGQVSKISKVSVVCAKTITGNIWYPTTKSYGRSVVCIKSGAVRKKKSVVWVCGVVKSKKLWFATSPLPPAVLQATAVVAPGVSEPVPVLESTEVATPSRPVVADNNVLANPTIADEPPVTTPVTIATVPSAPPVAGAASTPIFGSTTATADGFTVQISNYDLSYTWGGTATASGEVSINNTGFVTVTGVAAATSSIATITTTRTGYTGGSATVTQTSLGAALTPIFGSTTATADGFTVQISNYNASYTWAGTATASGKVSINNTGFVTVTGVTAATSSTVTITTTKQNTVGGSASVTAISLTCATGGICKVRDIGPGGGIVFYVATTPFTCGEDLKVTCTYLEAAITTGTGTSSWTPDTKAQWGCYGTFITGTSLEIGTGRANTKMITGQGCKGTDGSESAASIATAYNGGGKTDWFLPSRKELNALCLEFFNDPNSAYGSSGWWTAYQLDGCRGRQSAVTSAPNVTPVWRFAYNYYWSSSEAGANDAWFQRFYLGYQNYNDKTDAVYVRPVRAF
ncbi:MAG: DUF1566 domain-containing protein [Actinomycetota bacterium]